MNAPLIQGVKPPAPDAGRWHASLQLEFQRRRGSTRLTHSSHSGPLYIQKPFYPEGPDCAHAYLLHPPGGIVSGDCLEVDVLASGRTAVLVTTPGAARAYRARESSSVQRQITRLQVEAGASIEWLPLETIIYNGACVEVETEVQLHANAHCALWEITCLGLPASDAPFVQGQFTQRYRVTQDGRPVFIDGFTLDENNREVLSGAGGFRKQPVSGFFFLGPFVDDAWDQRLESLRETPLSLQYQDHCAVTRIGEYCVGRYLGDSAERARRIFTQWWQQLRPQLIGRAASSPRIWLT